MRKLAVCSGVAALLLCGTVSQAEIGLDTGLSTSLAGKYIFRGWDWGPTGLISDVYASYGLTDNLKVTGYFWNYTRLGAGRGSQENNYDASLTWTPSWFDGKLTITGGYVYYDRNNAPHWGPGPGPDTQEVYGGLDYDHWLRPSVYVYYDLDNVTGLYPGTTSGGVYVVGSVGHSWDLTEWGIKGWWLDADGWVGLDFGRGIDTFNDAGVRLAFSTELEEGLTFGPVVDLWFPSHQINPGSKSFQPTASLMFSYTKSY